MNFVENILNRLGSAPGRVVLQEVRDGEIVQATAGEVLGLIQTARAFLNKAGVRKGDRCALLAHNSIRWAALDLALMAEGIIVVPLYARQAPAELVGMMKDCNPSLVCCGDQTSKDAIKEHWSEAPPLSLFDEILASTSGSGRVADGATALSDEDPATIIYTSGTSGEPKGVILNVGNLNHMIPCTNARLDILMGERHTPDSIFHYLPFNFAGSWILLLTSLSRNSVLTMSTDLTKLSDEMKLAAPNYFLNVPVLLERIRTGVEDQVSKKGSLIKNIYGKGKAAWLRKQRGEGGGLDALWLGLAERLLFSQIRKKMGAELKALICGSAPLSKETQLFFRMLDMSVLQVYGLTETTAICTMDHPFRATPGRVGPAIPGVEMRLGEGDEILVRGPNVFPGYWNRPAETEKAFTDGWFRTGDQGDVDETGNWAIIGRIKNLIILSSGHNVAPEPIEEMVSKRIPGAQQVFVVGNGRGYLGAIVTGGVEHTRVETAIEEVNKELPHYKCIRAFQIVAEPFTIENGLLTANGKLKRDAIADRLQAQIEALYRTKKA